MNGRFIATVVFDILDREIDSAEISRCLRKLKNNKTGGSDGLVGELLKYEW